MSTRATVALLQRSAVGDVDAAAIAGATLAAATAATTFNAAIILDAPYPTSAGSVVTCAAVTATTKRPTMHARAAVVLRFGCRLLANAVDPGGSAWSGCRWRQRRRRHGEVLLS